MFMGITLCFHGLMLISVSFPHVYGDHTHFSKAGLWGQEFPPCLWGLPQNANPRFLEVLVSPMPMGINPHFIVFVGKGISFPHAYGDYACF